MLNDSSSGRSVAVANVAALENDASPLRVSAIHMLWANGTYGFCQWLTIVILAVLGGPAVVGTYAFGTALAMPFVAFAQLGLRQVLINDVGAMFSFQTFVQLRLAAVSLSYLAILGCARVLGYADEAFFVIAAVGLARCIESLTDIHLGYLQKHDRLDLVARLMCSGAVVNLVAVGSTFAITGSIKAASGAFVISCASTWLLVRIVQSSCLAASNTLSRTDRFESQTLYALIAKALPIGVANLFSSIGANCPRYVIEHLGGAALLGQYAVIEQFLVLGSLATNSVGQASSSRLARDYAMGRRSSFFSVLAKLFAFGAALGTLGFLGAWLIGPEVISSVYGAKFHVASDAFAPLMASAIFVYGASAMSYGFVATTRYVSLLWRNAAAAGITVVATILALPHYGLSGVAMGIAIGSVTSALLAFHGLRSWVLRSE